MNKLFKLGNWLLGIGIIPIGIGILNWWLIRGWFGGQGPSDYGSIEVSYISMARFINDFQPHTSWLPLWYFGFPFHLFYTPLLPYLIYIVHAGKGLSLWESYRLLTGIGFIAAPVSLYFLGFYLAKKKIAGVVAAVIYSIGPTIFYYVLPTNEVLNDRITAFAEPRRFVLLQRYGEGPHMFSLIFLPLAGLFYGLALEKKTTPFYVLAALFIGLTAMTNAVALYALAILLVAITFTHMATKKETPTGQALVMAGITYGLIAFWYNLSFISTFFKEGSGAGKNILGLFPWGMIGIGIVATIVFIFIRRLIRDRGIGVSLIWFGILFTIIYVYYTSFPPSDSERRLEFAPQALRYITEVDMALALLIGTIVAIPFKVFFQKNTILKLIEVGLSIALIAGLVFLIQPSLSGGFNNKSFSDAQKEYSLESLATELNEASQPSKIPLENTAQYEIAMYLKENVSPTSGRRVLIAGNYAYYFNYFTDIWQLRGGLYQAATHYWPEHIYYLMRFNKNPELAKAWLKAGNINYAVINYPGTRNSPANEYDASGLNKFQEFEKIYEKQGDIIYKIPLINDSPVKVINTKNMFSLKPPRKADDKEPLYAYVKWLEESPNSKDASFEMKNHDEYVIKAKTSENEGILVQMTYDKGWRAKTKEGKSLQVRKDPLGFTVVEPLTLGSQYIYLYHTKALNQIIGYGLTGLTITLLIIIPIVKIVRRRATVKSDVKKENKDE